MIYSGFHIVAMGLYSKRGCQNVVVTDTLSCTLFATYFFLPHFDFLCHSIPKQMHSNMESCC